MKLRMQITKEKEIRFISHLEYVRTIERAIRRAKLPAAYSEGFNPHLKFSLASALGVGVISMAEFVEIELAEPMEVHEAVQKMTAALPRGIQIMAADVTVNNAPALMASAGGADYLVVLPYSGEYVEAVAAFSAAEIKFFIPEKCAKQKNNMLTLKFSCRITPNGSMKAADLLNTLNQHFGMQLPVEKADITRLDLYRAAADGRRLPMLEHMDKSIQ